MWQVHPHQDDLRNRHILWGRGGVQGPGRLRLADRPASQPRNSIRAAGGQCVPVPVGAREPPDGRELPLAGSPCREDREVASDVPGPEEQGVRPSSLALGGREADASHLPRPDIRPQVPPAGRAYCSAIPPLPAADNPEHRLPPGRGDNDPDRRAERQALPR